MHLTGNPGGRMLAPDGGVDELRRTPVIGSGRPEGSGDTSFDGLEILAPTTGRYVVTFADPDVDPAPLLGSVAGLSRVASSRDFDDQAMDMAASADADANVFAELGMAVVSVDPDQLGALQTSAAARGQIVAVAPELVHHVMPEESADYVRGYRDGVGDLSGRLGAGPETGTETGTGQGVAPTAFRDDDDATWGLQAIHAVGSSRSGQGVRLAVLDTGMDLAHPDFVGRDVTARSFVAGEEPQDGHGHGTHCIGTASRTRPRSSRARCSATRAPVATPASWRASTGRSPPGARSSRCRWAPTCPGPTRRTPRPGCGPCSAAA